MLAISNHFERKNDEKNSLNLALIAEVEESSHVVDVDEIVVIKQHHRLVHIEDPTRHCHV
jgi:uncharacterized protein YdcH (DUF465 family)